MVGESDEGLLVSHEPGRLAVGEALRHLRQCRAERP
jgi:hypothetical protein